MCYVLSRAAGIKYICDFDDPFGGPNKKERTADTFKNIFEKIAGKSKHRLLKISQCRPGLQNITLSNILLNFLKFLRGMLSNFHISVHKISRPLVLTSRCFIRDFSCFFKENGKTAKRLLFYACR